MRRCNMPRHPDCGGCRDQMTLRHLATYTSHLATSGDALRGSMASMRLEPLCTLTLDTGCRLAFNPPSDNVQSPLASWHHPFDAACLGTDFVQQQAWFPLNLSPLCMQPRWRRKPPLGLA